MFDRLHGLICHLCKKPEIDYEERRPGIILSECDFGKSIFLDTSKCKGVVVIQETLKKSGIGEEVRITTLGKGFDVIYIGKGFSSLDEGYKDLFIVDTKNGAEIDYERSK